MKTFSIREALKFGWEKTKAHSALIFQVVLTLFALQVAYAIVGHTLEHTLIGFLAMVALAVGQGVLGVGATIITLKIAQGHHTSYNDILPSWDTFWRYFFATILAGLLIAVGFILLIIPGIYLALRFSMVRFAVLDGSGIQESLRKSSEMTKDIKWKLLGFFIVIGLLNILGFIAFMVGLLLTVPVTMLAYAHVYNLLKHHHA